MTSKGRAAGWAILLLLAVVAVGLLWMTHSQRQEQKLIGVWKMGVHEIQFANDHTFRDLGNPPQPSHGEYTVDFSQNPAWISIASRRNLASLELTPVYYFAGMPAQPLARGLIRFKTRNEIELVFTNEYAHPNMPGVTSGLGDRRPTSFEPSSQTLILTLTRIKR